MANAAINININSKGAEKSLNTLYADLEATREELDRLIKTYGENSKQADNMRKSLVGLETEINKLGGTTNEAVGSTQSLKTELRKLTDELATLEPGSQRFKELSIRASELKDQIQDTNDVVGQLAGNFTERLTRAITSAVGIGVAGFQAMTSAQALFGSENEDLQKTLVKLQALMNLSMAIETFGGLDQKLVEIKALFTSLTVTTEAQTIAQAENAAATVATDAALVGQTVATEGATVATTGLGTAMNLLPFAAVATAIGLVVLGLYKMSQSSNEANEQLDETIKLRKEEIKAYEPLVNKMKEEIGNFKVLITQLQQTNNGSKERRDLIKQINSQYGTTLKNIEDETAFQQQLNNLLVNYVALQRTRFKIESSRADSLKLFQKEEDLTLRLIDAEKELTRVKAIKDPISQEFYQKELDRAQGIVDTIKEQQKANEDAISQLAQDQLDYFNQEKQLLKQSGIETKKSNDVKSQSAEDYSKYLKEIQTVLDENTKVEEENFIKTQELSDKKVDVKDIERRKLEENIRKIYEANKKAITAEVQDEKKRTELLKANEDAYTKFQFTELEKVRLANLEANKKRLTDQQELNRLLLLEEQALKKEIRFGDGDTSDTLISNSNKVLQAQIRNLETQTKRSLIENRVSLKNEVEFYNQRQELQKQFIQNEDQSNKEAAQAELNRLMDLELQKYKLNEDYLITYNNLTQQYEVERSKNITKSEEDLIKEKEKYLKILEGLSQKQLKQSLDRDDEMLKNNALNQIEYLTGRIDIEKKISDNAVLIQENLNQVKENLNEEYNQKLLTQTSETNERLRDLDIETQNDIFEARIDKLSEYIDYAQQLYDGFNSIVQEAQDQRLAQEEMALDSFVSLEQTKLEQQLENRLITEEEYAARSKQIELKKEQDLLKLKRKQFKQDKALNLVQATIDGARATLSAFAGTPGDVIIKSIAAGIAAAFSAVQIGLIAKQQFTAAVGGIVPDNNQSRNVDSVDAKLAPGEAVINSNSTSSFLPLLSMINQLGGGKSLMPELPGDNGLNRFQPVYSQGNNQPVRAYVVNSDIENNMSKLDRIRRSTRF
jgi:hypothetical protein